ncbi:PaaX family transcriptional regulator C-terminal domain-containing protein [Streptomyces sp. BH106]|uniref:PaaX family transcriptional regulator n=1 Tax=Streptomyces sp. BH106 TaxID=3410409 RepID=UPI003CEC3D5A
MSDAAQAGGTRDTPGHETHAGRPPQQLLLAFLGTFALDRAAEPIPSRVFIDLLRDLGVTEMATRATLSRMVHRGLLARGKEGRVANFRLTRHAEKTMRAIGTRVRSRTPFTHTDDEWTLLSYSLPESRREVRDQLRSRLVWAGFGCVRDGLWIAPGTVDLDSVLSPVMAEAVAELGGFLARPLPSTPMDSIVRRAWDLPALREEHEAFLRRWSDASVSPSSATSAPPPSTVAQLTALVTDWLRVLHTDPGLPADYLADDWPAKRSTDAYWALWDQLEERAHADFERALRGR